MHCEVEDERRACNDQLHSTANYRLLASLTVNVIVSLFFPSLIVGLRVKGCEGAVTL